MRLSSSVRTAVLAFVTTRVVLVAACALVLGRFPTNTILHWQTDLFPGNNWINGWFRWDSFWYLAIADPSVQVVPPDRSSANFFPLYAWVSQLASLPFRTVLSPPHAFAAGALLVSNAAALAGLTGVHRITSRLAGARIADRAVWLMACFPFTFFLSAAYSDALYLCLAVWAFHFALDRHWAIAGIFGALAAMTRIPGVLLLAALGVEYVRRQGITAASIRRAVAPMAVMAIGPVLVAIYFWSQYGNPLAFLEARQVGWQRATGPAAAVIRDYGEFFAGTFACGSPRECFAAWPPTSHVLGVWYVALIPISVGLVLSRARLLGAGMTAWVLLSVIIAMANGLDGTGRFTIALFPVFIAAAAWLNTATLVAVNAFFAPFALLFLFQFARWRPVL